MTGRKQEGKRGQHRRKEEKGTKKKNKKDSSYRGPNVSCSDRLSPRKRTLSSPQIEDKKGGGKVLPGGGTRKKTNLVIEERAKANLPSANGSIHASIGPQRLETARIPGGEKDSCKPILDALASKGKWVTHDFYQMRRKTEKGGLCAADGMGVRRREKQDNKDTD